MNKAVLMTSSLALALVACNPASSPANKVDASASAAASTADVDAVKQMDAAFLTAIIAKDVDAIKANYAEDAVMVLPGQEPFRGVEAIAADYSKFAADPVGKFVGTNQSTVVSSGGDLAYSQGTYEVTYTNPKTKAVENGTGYYVIIYKKQADGSWKIVQDVSSPGPNPS